MCVIKRLLNNGLPLSILLILGMCSNKPDSRPILPNGAIGTGDVLLDQGTTDALNYIGSITGMTQWEIQTHQMDSILTYKAIDNLFLSTDKYKETRAVVYDGQAPAHNDGDPKIFNNEIASKNAEEGTISTTSDFKLFHLVGGSTDTYTEINKKGYSKIYTFFTTKSFTWIVPQLGGTAQWEETPSGRLSTKYAIVNTSSDTTLSIIYVGQRMEKEDGKYIAIPNQYILLNSIDSAIIYAANYTLSTIN